MEYNIENLKEQICKFAADKKAKDILILKVDHLTTLADYFIICSGRSGPQVKGVINNIEDELAKQGIEPLRREGVAEGRWAVLDYGEIVVHVFNDELRSTYCLDKLWGDSDGKNIAYYTYEE